MTAPARARAEDRSGLAHRAYELIEQLIVSQQIPAGSLVSEPRLMELTGLGRTPVREALQRLSRDRMVQIHPSKGVLVPSISVEEELRMLQVRRALEALAARLACENAEDETRAAMRTMAKRLAGTFSSLETYAQTVKETQALLVQGAGNEFLASSIAPLHGLSRRFWLAHVRDEAAEISTGARLYRELLDSVLHRDSDRAEQAAYALNAYLVNFSLHTLHRRYSGLGDPPA